MHPVVRLLAVLMLPLSGVLPIAPVAKSAAASVNQSDARCFERARGRAFVRVDAAGRILICVFKTEAHGAPYKITPQVLRVGDTLFVSAISELPSGELVMFTEVTEYPYQVLYGPLPRGSQLRITTRAPNAVQGHRAVLDTTIRVP